MILGSIFCKGIVQRGNGKCPIFQWIKPISDISEKFVGLTFYGKFVFSVYSTGL